MAIYLLSIEGREKSLQGFHLERNMMVMAVGDHCATAERPAGPCKLISQQRLSVTAVGVKWIEGTCCLIPLEGEDIGTTDKNGEDWERERSG